jgi:hypothetical protein
MNFISREHTLFWNAAADATCARGRARGSRAEKEEWSGDYFDAMHHGEHRCTGLDRWFLQLAA